MNKRKRLKPSIRPAEMVVSANRETGGRMHNKDWLSTLSLEILCHVLDYLPLKDVMKMDHRSKQLHEAVSLHLRVRKKIDFTEKDFFGWMSQTITDKTLSNLLSRCRDLEYVQGLHVPYIAKRRTRGLDTLSVPGITEALALCTNLKGVEISDIFLLEAVLAYLPEVEILGTFKNRIGNFPFDDANKLILSENPRITSLHLIGVSIPELPPLMYLKHLQLRWVNLSGPHPFMDFAAPQLQTFVMAHCGGPANSNPLKYVRLITSLATSQNLKRLELIRVPILGGLLQHVVEDSWRIGGFKKINHLKFGACKFILEMDIGYLVITAAPNIEELSLQPSMTKDSLFISLRLADVSFKFLQTLHLGFVDAFPEPGQWTNEDLIAEHLSDVVEHPAMVTDVGMKSVGQCFPELKHVQIYNCPHINNPTSWLISGTQTWIQLRELYLRRCHAIRLADFCLFIDKLPNLELLHLEHMFREPPKGCSRVGLSAGTGLGMSSALVGSHQGPNISDIGDDSENENDNNNNELVHQGLGDILDEQGATEHVPANREGVNTSSVEHVTKPANQTAEDNILTNKRTDSVETSEIIGSEVSCIDHDQTPSKPEGCMCEHQTNNTEGIGSVKLNSTEPTETSTSVLGIVLPIQSKTDIDVTEMAPHQQPSSSQQLLLIGSKITSETRTPFSVSSSLISHPSSNRRSENSSSGISHDQIFIPNETGTSPQEQKLCSVSGESEKMLPTGESVSYTESKMNEAVSRMKAEHVIELEDRMEEGDEEDTFLLHGEDIAYEDTWSDDDKSSDGQDSSINRKDSKLGKVTDDTAHCDSNRQDSDTLVERCKAMAGEQKDFQRGHSGLGNVNSKAQEENSLSVYTLGEPKHSDVLEGVEKMDTSGGLVTEHSRFPEADGSANLNCEDKGHQGMGSLGTFPERQGLDSARQPTNTAVCSVEVNNHREDSDSKMCDICQRPHPLDSKGYTHGQTCNTSQAPTCTKCDSQSYCQSEGRQHSFIESESENNQLDIQGKGQDQYRSNHQGQGHNLMNNKGQGQCQSNNEGQVQNETDLVRNSTSNEDRGIETNPIKMTTNGILIPDSKESKQVTTDGDNASSSLKHLIKCENESKLEISIAKLSDTREEKFDDVEEEEEEEEEYSDEDEEETVLIVRREEPRGYKVTSEKVNRAEKVIQENNITLSGEVSVRSLSGEITIDPTQGQMAGIVSNVVIMLGMTMRRPKATGTRQLGRDIVVTVAGRSTYVGSGEIDVSIVSGKKIIAILQTDQPAGPCETLSDVLRNCGLPSILHLITEGDLQEINRDKSLVTNVGRTQTPVWKCSFEGEDHENVGLVESNEEGHLKAGTLHGEQCPMKVHSDCTDECKTTATSDRDSVISTSHEARNDEGNTKSGQTKLEESEADKINCDQSQGQVPDQDKIRCESQVQNKVPGKDLMKCKIPVQDQAPDTDMMRCKSPVQNQALDRDMMRCKSPVQDQAPDRDMIKCKSPVQDQAPDQDMIKCKSPVQDQARDRDMIRCDCPVRGILHTCSGMVVLLSPCCQMYGNMRIRDAQVSSAIPPSAFGAFWSCTVDDPGPSTVVDPKLAVTKVDNSIQKGKDNDKACQTLATSSQSDPSNQVISCLSMGGPTTHNSVGVSTISNSGAQVGSHIDGKRMIDQATSTSDPVIEDDHIQILEIKSRSLTCLSLNMVGITDLVLTDCPKLSRVTGCACRVLKKVKTQSAPKLQKMSFAQCRKLDEEFLLEQIASLAAVKNRVVYLRPLHEFDRASLEERLFGGHEVDYGLCVVYDYNPSPQDSMYNRTRVATWPHLFIGINLELLQSYNFRQWDGVTSSKYPWDRNIYTMAGENENGSKWELTTDIPWLRPLSECTNLSQSRLSTQDQKVGVYCPAAKGHFSVTECLADLQNDIAEKQAGGIGLVPFSVVVYINMCDVSGEPVHDPYI
ncbi:uncharacterized protein LOC110451330 [Mizuhopecten yessoensis]|uniref:F-box only protein 38 n=1 Tax=Mizuhopecten yessoensis TaxID=6573 RepID=A0A210QLU8_MIZYE|nr:uncharacterized protein LOC110451330 [Mizuhopecten yessoensis]OWF49713.1 F-box only protein 38 [Mizuhopecten yessoensis]